MTDPYKSFRDSTRKESGSQLRGTAGPDKERAHLLGHKAAKDIMNHRAGPGRPVTNAHVIPAIDFDNVWTPKVTKSNRVLDERRDPRIVDAACNGTLLREGTTIDRARQMYKDANNAANNYAESHGGRRSAQLDGLCDAIGNVSIAGSGPGRPRMVKNLDSGSWWA